MDAVAEAEGRPERRTNGGVCVGKVMDAVAEAEAPPLEGRPGILIVGSPSVGKRTILSRLLPIEFGDALDSSSGTLCHGWTITTKYYSADVSIWTAHLDDEFSLGALPMANKLVALVMVFDLNDLASFSALKAWVSTVDTASFDILMCIANKVDLLPGHFAHVEYRRNLKKQGEFFSDPHPEFADYGILNTESSSLLGEEETPLEIRRSCLDWCIQYNIEYIEACASNADFDKFLSVNGDVQGVDRLYGALSAHMWPGMILKSGDKVMPLEVEDLEASDESSEFELEYEILSRGSAEPWDDSDDSWLAFTEARSQMAKGDGATDQETLPHHVQGMEQVVCPETKIPISDSHLASSPGSSLNEKHDASVPEESSSRDQLPSSNSRQDDVKDQGQSSQSREGPEVSIENAKNPALENCMAKLDQEDDEMLDGKCLEFEDMERLMSEIGNVRDNLRFMPDFQRRDMAAKVAMKMAAMFGCDSDDE